MSNGNPMITKVQRYKIILNKKEKELFLHRLVFYYSFFIKTLTLLKTKIFIYFLQEEEIFIILQVENLI